MSRTIFSTSLFPGLQTRTQTRTDRDIDTHTNTLRGEPYKWKVDSPCTEVTFLKLRPPQYVGRSLSYLQSQLLLLFLLLPILFIYEPLVT